MGKIFTLTDSIKTIASNAIDDLIDQLGKDCLLLYPPTPVECGNCFVSGTYVTTEYGFKNIEDIKIGDIVLSGNKQKNKVTGLMSSLYKGILYNFQCYGLNTDFYVTSDHKYPVITNFRDKFTQKQWYDKSFILNTNLEYLEAKDIKEGDAVILPKDNFSQEEVKYIDCGEFGKVKCGDDLLEVLGWWLAEGCLQKSKYIRTSSFCLRASKEEGVADFIIQVIYDNFGIKGKKEFRKDADNLLVHVHSSKFARFLLNFGLGAKNKKIPEDLYKLLSIRQLQILCKGLLAGDGCNYTDKDKSQYNRIILGIISKELSFQVWNIMHYLDYYPTLCRYKKEGKQDVWVNTWTQNRIQQKSGVRNTNHGIASIVKKIKTKTDFCKVYTMEVEENHFYTANGILTSNCIFDPIGNKSSNKWVTGGPLEFSGGLCPSCGGEGFVYEQQSDTIRQLVAWEPSKYFVKPPANIQIPDGQIQCKTYLEHLQKVQQCKEMILQPSLQHLIRWRFKLIGEPLDPGNIIQNRYMVTLWRRSG